MIKENLPKVCDEVIESTLLLIDELTCKNQISESLNLCLKLLELNVKNSRIWTSLGNCYYFSKRFEESIHCWKIALNLNSKTPYYTYTNIAQALLMTGNLIDGFALFESRLTLLLNYYPQKAMWKGENISGKTLLILHDNGGLGDSIMCLRYIPYLKQLGCKILVNIQPELKSLFQHLEVPVFSLPPGSDLVCDRFVFFCSLPFCCKTELSNIPPPIKIKASHQPIRGRIGIVWRASIDTLKPTGISPNRSISLSELIPILEISEIDFICAQKEISYDEAALLDKYQVARPHIETFTDTLKILESCELLISVDTSVPHLSASMEIPTWLLLPYNSCWKWLIDRTDSPWYPSLKLFRQKTENIWDGQIQEIKKELKILYNIHDSLHIQY